jgi:3-oxoacyl-[acyl-carrier protein] reductase
VLQDKVTIVFAATGAIAGEVARSFARHGAVVHASGRDADALERLRVAITGAGGRAETAVVDATDDRAVADHVRAVAEREGRVDAVFNGIGGRPAELRYPAASATLGREDFLAPQERILWSTFLTTRAATGVMAERGGGSIVTMSASLSGTPIPLMAALSATCGGIEAMSRSLAAEFSPAGVRVNCVRGDAMPETSTIQETMAGQAAIIGVDPADMPLPPGTPLGRPISVAETAATIAFLASDLSSGTTAQVVDVGGRVMPG